jgi:hypothetical protein
MSEEEKRAERKANRKRKSGWETTPSEPIAPAPPAPAPAGSAAAGAFSRILHGLPLTVLA